VSISLPIETERLLVRCFLPEADAKPMFEVYGDPEVMRFIPRGALADEEAVRSPLERYRGAPRVSSALAARATAARISTKERVGRELL